MDEVARVMVLGHASQNPFTLFGESEFEKQEKERKRMLETQYRDFVPRKSDKENVGAEIEHILDMEDESQKGGKGAVVQERELDKQEV